MMAVKHIEQAEADLRTARRTWYWILQSQTPHRASKPTDESNEVFTEDPREHVEDIEAQIKLAKDALRKGKKNEAEALTSLLPILMDNFRESIAAHINDF